MNEIRTKSSDEKFCSECGEIIKLKAEICPKCGVRQKDVCITVNNGKSRTSYILLGLFFGCFGIHNFYAGYTVKAIIQLALTLLSLIAAAANDVEPVWLWIVAIWAFVEVIIIKKDSSDNAFV